MGYINGVNLLPSTGEFIYDTVPYLGQRVTETRFTSINRYANGGPLDGTGTITDYTIALDDLQAQIPDCETVALVIAWFGNSTDASACQIYPSTTYIGGSFQQAGGAADSWRCSGLTQVSRGLIAIPQAGDAFIYGGTPSDQSIVRCIQDLKARGLRTVFYPFLLMTAAGEPWRGRITYNGSDISSAATAAVDGFLGSAATSQFSRDATNLTVAYSGSPTDYTYRRMILHYANLCVIAGGVDLFILGSEFRGLETIRGPAWTKAGTTGSDGNVTWDYPFVAGMMQLADDVRSVFDTAGLTKDTSGLHNLIAYSADWSDWMGFQHPGENGQWPHLDQLYGHSNIDLVSFDSYLPLSDWTTDGGLDAICWSDPAPDPSAWPPAAAEMNGLGLTGQPSLTSIAYLKANIEGGEKFNWYYNDGANDGLGLDPYGTDLRVSLPEGDRLAQNRQPYYPSQQLLANKQLRWWWNNPHHAIYDDGDGTGWSPHGPATEWAPQSKSIIFAEYGIPSCDKGTNQPNVFFSPASVESFTPYWSIWDPVSGGGFLPRIDDEIQLLALQAIYEYWVNDGNNATSASGVKMIEPTFLSAWNWDARPFPIFPQLSSVWGDTGDWAAGQWLSGKGPFLTPLVPDAVPIAPAPASFPTLSGQGWSVHYRPAFATGLASHVSGRESRAAKMSLPLWEIELSFDLLRMDMSADLQTLAGFYDAMAGQEGTFTFPIPAELGIGSSLTCRFDDDSEDLEEFMSRLFSLQSLKLRSVK
ncbi:MAG: glycoside hydrolase TIM-barrel-like domain-containing protein [Methylovirgula sp.]